MCAAFEVLRAGAGVGHAIYFFFHFSLEPGKAAHNNKETLIIILCIFSSIFTCHADARQAAKFTVTMQPTFAIENQTVKSLCQRL